MTLEITLTVITSCAITSAVWAWRKHEKLYVEYFAALGRNHRLIDDYHELRQEHEAAMMELQAYKRNELKPTPCKPCKTILQAPPKEMVKRRGSNENDLLAFGLGLVFGG